MDRSRLRRRPKPKRQAVSFLGLSYGMIFVSRGKGKDVYQSFEGSSLTIEAAGHTTTASVRRGRAAGWRVSKRRHLGLVFSYVR